MPTRPRGSGSASRTCSSRRSSARRSRSRWPRRTSGSSASTASRRSSSRRSRRAYEGFAQRIRPYVARHVAARRPRAATTGARCCSRARRARCSTSTTARIRSSPRRTPSPANAATGIGIGPNRIDAVIGVAKAYVTRVGEGPFPTEIEGADQERVRDLGGEFGTVTGRERRCGWLDLVALRYAVRLNGITSLALTKLDVLSEFEELPVCVAYRLRDGTETDDFPAHQSDFHHCRPVYETLPGWQQPLTDGAARRGARATSQFVERELGVEITLVGTGAERERVVSMRVAPRARRASSSQTRRKAGIESAREGAAGRVRRARARARVEAAPERRTCPSCTPRPGNPGIATLGRCHPVRAEDGEGLLALAGALESTSSSSGPRRRSWQESPTSSATRESPSSDRALPPRGSRARSRSRRTS